MAKEGRIYSFPFSFGSFLLISQRAVGLCYLFVLCILCFEHVRLRSLTCNNSGGASCSQIRAVLPVAAASHDYAKEPQEKGKKGETVALRNYVTRSGRGATVITPSLRPWSKKLSAGGSKRTISARESSTSSSAADERKGGPSGGLASALYSWDLSGSRQRAFGDIGTKTEAAEKESGDSSSGSSLPRTRRSSTRGQRRPTSAAQSSRSGSSGGLLTAKGDEKVEGPETEGGEQKTRQSGTEQKSRKEEESREGSQEEEEGKREGGDGKGNEEEPKGEREKKLEAGEEQRGELVEKVERKHARADKSSSLKQKKTEDSSGKSKDAGGTAILPARDERSEHQQQDILDPQKSLKTVNRRRRRNKVTDANKDETGEENHTERPPGRTSVNDGEEVEQQKPSCSADIINFIKPPPGSKSTVTESDNPAAEDPGKTGKEETSVLSQRKHSAHAKLLGSAGKALATRAAIAEKKRERKRHLLHAQPASAGDTIGQPAKRKRFSPQVSPEKASTSAETQTEAKLEKRLRKRGTNKAQPKSPKLMKVELKERKKSQGTDTAAQSKEQVRRRRSPQCFLEANKSVEEMEVQPSETSGFGAGLFASSVGLSEDSTESESQEQQSTKKFDRQAGTSGTRGQAYKPADENTAYTGRARRAATGKEVQERKAKAVPQKKRAMTSQGKEKTKQSSPVTRNLPSRMHSATQKWRKEGFAGRRTKQQRLSRAYTPSTQVKVEQALSLRGRQLQRRQDSSALANSAQRRSGAPFRHLKQKRLPLKRARKQYQPLSTRSLASMQPAPLLNDDEEYQPSSRVLQQSPSPMQQQPPSPLQQQPQPQSQTVIDATPHPSQNSQNFTFSSSVPNITVDNVSAATGGQGEKSSTGSGKLTLSAQQPPPQPQASQSGEVGEQQQQQDVGCGVEGTRQPLQFNMNVPQDSMPVLTTHHFTFPFFEATPVGSPQSDPSREWRSTLQGSPSPLSTPHVMMSNQAEGADIALEGSRLPATSTSVAANISSSEIESHVEQREAAWDHTTLPAQESTQQEQSAALPDVGTGGLHQQSAAEGEEQKRFVEEQNSGQSSLEEELAFPDLLDDTFVDDNSTLSSSTLLDEFLGLSNSSPGENSSIDEIQHNSGKALGEDTSPSMGLLEQPGVSREVYGIQGQSPNHPGAALPHQLELQSDIRARLGVPPSPHTSVPLFELHGVGGVLQERRSPERLAEDASLLPVSESGPWSTSFVPPSASAASSQPLGQQPLPLEPDSGTPPQPPSQHQSQLPSGAGMLPSMPFVIKVPRHRGRSELDYVSSQRSSARTSAAAQLYAEPGRSQNTEELYGARQDQASGETDTQFPCTASTSQGTQAPGTAGAAPVFSERTRNSVTRRRQSRIQGALLRQALILLRAHQVLSQHQFTENGQSDSDESEEESNSAPWSSYMQQGVAPSAPQRPYTPAYGVPGRGVADVPGAAVSLGGHVVPEVPFSGIQPSFSSQQATPQVQAPLTQHFFMPPQATPHAQQQLLLSHQATLHAHGLMPQQNLPPQQTMSHTHPPASQQPFLPELPVPRQRPPLSHLSLLSQHGLPQVQASPSQHLFVPQEASLPGQATPPQLLLLSLDSVPQSQLSTPRLFLLQPLTSNSYLVPQQGMSHAEAFASQVVLPPHQATSEAHGLISQQVSSQQNTSQAQDSTNQQDASTEEANGADTGSALSLETPVESVGGPFEPDGQGNSREELAHLSQAPARRLHGEEEEEEELLKRGDQQNTVSLTWLENEVLNAGFPVLQHLGPDLRGSPLATLEGNSEEETALDRADGGLTEREILLKIVACFNTVERHFSTYRAKYVSLVDREAPNLGMREDEVLRLLFHAAWVTCYYNVKKQQLPQLVDGRISSKDELLLLRRTAKTPVRFSRKQHSLTEEIIRRFAREYPADEAEVNGTLGIIYSMLIITGVFVCLFTLHRFYRTRWHYESTTDKTKIINAPKNNRFELSCCVKHSGSPSPPPQN